MTTDKAKDRAKPKKNRRRLAWVVVTLVYATALWFWIFPWIDRTFVSRPAF